MFYLILFVLAFIATYFIRHYAIKKSIMDVPNERSSHTTPTPRGGGLAIIFSIYFGLIVLYITSNIESGLFFALLCSIPIVIVSLIDDIISLSSKLRFMAQLFSAILAVYFLGGVSSIDFILFNLEGWYLNIIVVVAIIWFTNLYNFLDGIDGYSGSQAVLTGTGSFIILQNEIGLIIALSSLGFLFFNFPLSIGKYYVKKASIFMGDVGSATLGFLFAILCFSDTSGGNIYVWLILLGLFWFDATITIIRRYKNKENITEAHKKHAYQRLTQSGWSHFKVSTSAIVLNIVFVVGLYFSSKDYYLYLFTITIIILYFLVKFIDSKKAFN